MAVDRPEVYIINGLVATGDLSSNQYYLVKAASTAGTVKVVSATTDVPLGVLYNKPTDGNAAEVVAGGIMKCVFGGTVTYGTHLYVGPNSTGQVVAKSTKDDVVCGIVIETGASGEIHPINWQQLVLSTGI